MLDERTRFEMYLGLEEKLGTHVADTLMQHLPPVGWADVATKQGLATLEGRMDLRIDGLEQRLDLRFDGLEERMNLRFDGLEERMSLRIDTRIHAEVNRLLLFLFPTILTSLGLAVAVARMG